MHPTGLNQNHIIRVLPLLDSMYRKRQLLLDDDRVLELTPVQNVLDILTLYWYANLGDDEEPQRPSEPIVMSPEL